jgi:C4-dicarboxylate-binding protein DctP
MFQSRKILSGLLASIAITTLSVTGAFSASEIRVSYETSDTHLKARTMAVFKEELEKVTDGGFKVTTYPNSSLISSKQEVTAAIRGQVEAIVPFISYYETITPKAKLLTTPLVFSGYDHLTRAMEGTVGASIMGDLDAKGLKALGFWYETPTLLFTSDEKIATLEELKGLKIRTYPSETLENMLGALGANATVIPGSEVYLALQNGTVDGAVTTPSFAVSLKLDEVLKYAVDIKLVLGGYIFAMNKTFYDGLDADEKSAVDAAAAIATAWNKAEIDNEIQVSLDTAATNGLEVVTVDAAEMEKWQAAMTSVYDGLGPELKELLKSAKSYQ